MISELPGPSVGSSPVCGVAIHVSDPSLNPRLFELNVIGNVSAVRLSEHRFGMITSGFISLERLS